MADISAEGDEGVVWCGSNQARDVPNGVAGNVENVEAAIGQVVVG